MASTSGEHGRFYRPQRDAEHRSPLYQRDRHVVKLFPISLCRQAGFPGSSPSPMTTSSGVNGSVDIFPVGKRAGAHLHALPGDKPDDPDQQEGQNAERQAVVAA